jgi:hypothetical protein
MIDSSHPKQLIRVIRAIRYNSWIKIFVVF